MRDVIYLQTCRRISPISAWSPLTARSPRETTPLHSSLSSRTGSLQIFRFSISLAASWISWSSRQTTTPSVIASATRAVFGSRPWAMTRTTISRSVTMPETSFDLDGHLYPSPSEAGKHFPIEGEGTISSPPLAGGVGGGGNDVEFHPRFIWPSFQASGRAPLKLHSATSYGG